MLARAVASLLLCIAVGTAAIPTPKEHFGYSPGDDYKLADYSDLIGYFKKLEQSSARIRLVEFGKTSYGKPMYVAFVSTEENLKRLEQHRAANRRLALGEAAAEEARALAAEGKVFVWIDSGLHATEVAPAQHAPHLAYRMLTDESEEMRRIRDKVILLQVPCINPDGLDLVVHWYRSNAGTPHELAGPPQLYQKYAGHDNNRDYFMLNLAETRHVSRMLFREWFPQIVYNQHQTGPFPARIFVPPYSEPLNPNIPAAVMEGINLIGSAMKERFARENKPGVLSYWGYDAWWNGGLRSAPAFHNMHGILTETAHPFATPIDYKSSDLPERFGNGMPTREPGVFYQRPWLGGRWRLRDAVDYMLTADMAILDLASSRPTQFLYKAYEMARAAIDAGRAGKPYAYLLPMGQWDDSSALAMLDRLHQSGVEVWRSRSAFQANGQTFSEGTFVLPAAQPFRAHLVDLMEPHKYPELRSGTTGPTKRPYDIAGWTLWMQMGVTVRRAEDTFQADLEKLRDIPPVAPALDQRQNAAFLAIANSIEAGNKPRWSADGTLSTSSANAAWELARPRPALYEPWIPNLDQGWTQWLLDTYRVPHTVVHNDDIRMGGLRERFDSLILASQSADSILHGQRPEDSARIPGVARDLSRPRPEQTGGIGIPGLAAIEAFVRDGGTLITLHAASDLAMQFLSIPVRNALQPPPGREGRDEPAPTGTFYSPGSLLRLTVDPIHPIAFGMPKEAYGFSNGGYAFEVTGDSHQAAVIARYASSNLLASGWVSGERAVLGKPVLVEAKFGKGRVVLFGFRPQHRGQTFGTFKFVLNAIYLASAQPL